MPIIPNLHMIDKVFLCSSSKLANVEHDLQENEHQMQPTSCYFPDVDLETLIAQCLKTASDRGTGVAMRELRSSLASE